MSTSSTHNLINDCGCCEGQTASTPQRIDNRPGLPAISYRVGDYHRFKDSMLARLSSSELPALKGLGSRDDNDFSIALIDAWAMVSEVLCFYNEYFANESLLRTAKERLSILEHARLIGYQLQPGVSATTYVAFTLDEAPVTVNNPVVETIISAGVKIQSTPGPDETAQLYETENEIIARVDWNAIRPRITQPQDVNSSMQSVVLSGITTFVKPGDELLIVNGTLENVVKVLEVISDDKLQTIQLKLSGSDVSPNTFQIPNLPEGSFTDFDDTNVLNDGAIATFVGRSWKMEDVVAIVETKHWDIDELMQRINANSELGNLTTNNNSSVYGFRKRAQLFGYNAQKRVTYTNGTPDDISQWDEWGRATDEDESTVFLNNAYEEVVVNGYLILHSPELTEEFWYSAHSHYHYSSIPSATIAYRIDDASVIARTVYGISSKSSKIELSGNLPGWDYSPNMLTLIRQAEVLVQSEALDLTQVPIDEKISGDRILLERADLYLRNQQYVSISGERHDQQGIVSSEVLQIKEVRLEHGFTLLVFTTSLSYEYTRDTVSINANVAVVSHGESVSEILGNGDASLVSQSFSLKQTPLTYIGADTTSGVSSTLEIRVNNVLWHEVQTFLGAGSDEKIYTTKLTDEGVTIVYFGDGIEGARLPSGNNNIIANYRKGSGIGGLVKSKQLNLLLTRPLGIKDAINPVASCGGDDAENIDDARVNAPLGLLTLNRAVSLQDYEDYSRGFAGVRKARAVAVSRQGVPRIYISLAGPDGALIEPSTETYKNLLSSLKISGDPYAQFTLLSYRPAYFKLDAELTIHADYINDLVLEAARLVLRQTFSFDAREFNQPVHLSEVISTLQKIEGVIAVDVNYLYRSDGVPVDPPSRSLMPDISTSGDKILGAELLTLDPAPLDQLKVKS